MSLSTNAKNIELSEQKIKSLKKYLEAVGVQVLEPTSDYECFRFLGSEEKVGIIYENKEGRYTFVGEAEIALKCFQSKGKTPYKINKKKKRRVSGSSRRRSLKNTLKNEQGSVCFYCLKEEDINDLTFDHLVPFNCGGPNHISNLVLACEDCNQKFGHMSPYLKILEREKHLRGKENG